MKNLIAFVCSLLLSSAASGQKMTECRIDDEGGAGTHKAMVALYEDIPGCMIYRPVNILHAASKTTLPIVLFSSGQQHSVDFERFLTEIASFGYIIIADGSYSYEDDVLKLLKPADVQSLRKALLTLREKSEEKGSVFNGVLDFSNVAYMGRLSAPEMLSDLNLMTYLCLDSSISDPHKPSLFIVGSLDEKTYAKAKADLDNAGKSFVAAASIPIGREGTYSEAYGGSYSTIAIQWLEWQLKGKEWSRKIFTGEECICMYSGWEIEYRNEQNVIH